MFYIERPVDSIQKLGAVATSLGFYAAIVYFNLNYLFPNYLNEKRVFLYILLFILAALVATPLRSLVMYWVYNRSPEVQQALLIGQGSIFLSHLAVGAGSTMLKIAADWTRNTREQQKLKAQNLQSELYLLVEGDEIRFHLENNKPKIEDDFDVPGGIGLINVKRRLDLLYDGRYELNSLAVNKAVAAKAGSALIDSHSEEVDRDYIFVKAEKKLIKVEFNEVVFIEGLKDYVIIRNDETRVITLQTMKSLEAKLPSSIFRRVHRSYIVNLLKVEAVEGNSLEVTVKGQKKLIAIGKNYRESLLAHINSMKL